jgi:hypothetical protein
MPDTDAGPRIRPPGWYRVTKDGWAFVCGPDQDPGEEDPLGLVLVEHGAEEVPLW